MHVCVRAGEEGAADINLLCASSVSILSDPQLLLLHALFSQLSWEKFRLGPWPLTCSFGAWLVWTNPGGSLSWKVCWEPHVGIKPLWQHLWKHTGLSECRPSLQVLNLSRQGCWGRGLGLVSGGDPTPAQQPAAGSTRGVCLSGGSGAAPAPWLAARQRNWQTAVGRWQVSH